MVLMRGVTREECCAGGRLDTAWFNTSLPMNEVSLLGFLGIVACKPCKGNPMEDEPVRSASAGFHFLFVLCVLKGGTSVSQTFIWLLRRDKRLKCRSITSEYSITHDDSPWKVCES